MPAPQSASTVSVACKLPHGLELRLFKPVKTFEPVLGGNGSREVLTHQPLPGSVQIAGNSHPQNHGPRSPIVGGFALTHGVPKDFWDQWYDANKDADMVRNGMIFAHTETRSTEAEAKEKEGLRSGMERLDPNNLPPQFSKGPFKIETMKREA